MAQPYEIVSVRRAKRPLGVEGSNWHRYVIAFEGTNNIHGYRQGNLKAVTRAVEEIVAQLNERHRMPRFALGIRGYLNLVPTPKKNIHK